MKSKYLFVLALLLVLALAGYGFTLGFAAHEEEGEGIRIVTSFYPMQIAAMNLTEGCEGVKLECLSEPQTGCLHDYQLTPQDMILLSEADIFIINGGGIEGFLAEVAEEYPQLVVIDAGEAVFSGGGEEADVEPDSHEGEGASGEEETHGEHSHGENAHAWMSISHYMQQVEGICDGLSEADPANASVYQKNRDLYLQKIRQVEEEAREVRTLTEGRHIVVFHEAYEYLAEDLGLTVDGLLNLDEERQVSAGEIADIISAIRENGITVLLAEEEYGRDMGEAVEQETGCKVYYLDTLVRGEVSPDAWLAGMEENLKLLAEAFRER